MIYCCVNKKNKIKMAITRVAVRLIRITKLIKFLDRCYKVILKKYTYKRIKLK